MVQPSLQTMPVGKQNSIGENGEPNRGRTCDNLIKSQVLYQLSYGPPFAEYAMM